ncbi:MAG: hypothetical protein K0S93_2408, partial [Nitrososphaeraceae archaeon]|nr:hypothetical protein [Nitrososphaeraceae archaeon]
FIINSHKIVFKIIYQLKIILVIHIDRLEFGKSQLDQEVYSNKISI